MHAREHVPRSRHPHLQQAMCEALPLLPLHALPRLLREDAPRLRYRRRRGELKSVVHWGQRKLLIGEVEFLTRHAQPGATCVYAGAAPGSHIELLAELFPELRFVLVDPAPFAIRSSERVRIWQEFMTDDVAREFVGERTLLISDIRSADWKVLTPAEMEAAVRRDMDWQLSWYRIMRPQAAMFKFRLPWDSGSSTYLDGDVYLPIWGPQTTTEARLVVASPNQGLRTWDHRRYQEQMFYFNTVTRVLAYEHDVVAAGLDHCYDCAAEVRVLKEYLTSRHGGSIKASRLAVQVSCLVQRVTEACGGSTHGRNLVHWQHRNSFRVRTYDTQNLRILEHADESAPASSASLSAQQKKRQLLDAVAAGAKWADIPEPPLDEVEWGAGQRSSLGIGSFVPPESAVALWVWCLTAELTGQQAVLFTQEQEQDQEQQLVHEERARTLLRQLLAPAGSCLGRDEDMTPCVLLCTGDGAAFTLYFDENGGPGLAKLHLPFVCADDPFTCLCAALADDPTQGAKRLLLLDIWTRRGEPVHCYAAAPARLQWLRQIRDEIAALSDDQMIALKVLAGINRIDVAAADCLR